MDFELFKSQLIRSLQDVGHSDAEIAVSYTHLTLPTMCQV